MKKINLEILETINGCEVNSDFYEQCVGVQGNKVIAMGVQIDTLDTDAKIKRLFKEIMNEEGDLA